jgi:hypothetical protein
MADRPNNSWMTSKASSNKNIRCQPPILTELLTLPEHNDIKNLEVYREKLAQKLDSMQGQDLPSTSAFRAAYYHIKGFPYPNAQNMDPRILASFSSTILASILNLNEYHGNRHFREIPIVGTILTEAEMKYGGFIYSHAEIAEILISHDAHDLFHNGRNNMVNGVHVACFLEERSFDAAAPYLEACGLNEETMRVIATALWATEAAPDPKLKQIGASAPTRAQCAAKAYDFHFNGGPRPVLPDDMALLLDESFSPELVFGAAVANKTGQAGTIGARASRVAENMRIADIFASLLRYESFKLRYDQLHRENPEVFKKSPEEVGPADWKGFVQFVLGGYKDEAGNFVPAAAAAGANAIFQRHLIAQLFLPAAPAPGPVPANN